MNSTGTGHLSDAELVRYLDEGGEPAESGRWRRHVEECRQCDDALRTVRGDSQLVSEWLERAAFEADAGPVAPHADPSSARPPHARPTTEARGILPRRPAMTPWLRAAAILVLLAAPVAAFPGLRGWIADRVAPATDAADPAVTVASPDEPTVLRFIPEPGEFVVRFDPDSDGVITIDRTDGYEAELRATGGEPETTVSASLLQIRNSESARYRLRLPAATTGVWVMIGERAVAVSGAQIDRRTVVGLR